MKKVTNISIGERVFSIEEDAFDVLQKYLNEIGNYFEKQESDDEILKDIEFSISEKLENKKRSMKVAVNIKDVEEIIGELGTLEELIDGDTNIPSNLEEKRVTVKQLYRDGENKVIAGVSSGIANYFGIDPIIVRVSFIFFVFLSGFGIVLYLILWVIVPIAKTASQKLSMKGEAANLENITEFFDEKVKKKVKKSTIKKFFNFPFVVFGLFFEMLKKIIPAVRVIIGISITLVVSILIFLLSTFFLVLISGGIGLDIDKVTLEIFTILQNIQNYSLILGSVFSIIFIPLFLSLIGGIYLIFKRKVMGVNVFVILFLFWIASLSFLTVNIAQNSDTIEKIATKLGEHTINDGENFHILEKMEK